MQLFLRLQIARCRQPWPMQLTRLEVQNSNAFVINSFSFSILRVQI